MIGLNNIYKKIPILVIYILVEGSFLNLNSIYFINGHIKKRNTI